MLAPEIGLRIWSTPLSVRVAEHQIASMPPASAHERMGLEFLTATLALGLWVAVGSLALAAADGLGEHPARRAGIGIALVAGYAAALWKRRELCALLRARPQVVIVLTVALLAATLADDRLGGAYVAVSLTAVGVATIAARARTVWLCVALLGVGTAVAVFAVDSPAVLARDGDLGGVVGLLVGYPVAAALILGLRRLLTGFVGSAGTIIPALRAGAPALTPALEQAIARPGTRLLLPPSPAPAQLTPTEIHVVERLAGGLAPKQIAREMNVALATVRTHLRNAKRKTAARTLRELAGLVTHRDWPLVERLRG
jgi:DNA-binding CsgD family transcriptional regulator